MSMARSSVSLAVILFCSAGLAAGPQERPPQVFGVDVRLVAIPVFVTDKHGQSVSGLTADDFEVEDQGKNVPIAGFLSVDAGASTADLPPGTSPALVAASRRQFLLLFDQSFSTSSSVLKAREGALRVLKDGTQPGDLVAVASLGPAGLRVMTSFTPDRTQAARAVATFGTGDATRLRDPLGLAFDLGIPLQVDVGTFGLQTSGRYAEETREQILQLARSEREQYRQRVVAYLDSLEGLGKLLDSVQGRKQVILLSSGFDQSMLTGATGTEQAENAASVATGRLWEVQGDRHFGDAQARDRMDRLFEALTRSDTVVHTVYVADASAGASPAEQGSVPAGGGRETLAELAGRSGGQFVREPTDLANALRDVLAATRYYYVVAFEPVDSKKKPDELRKVKIRVKRPALTVSHRAGYTIPGGQAASETGRQLTAADVIAKGLSGGAFRLSALPVPYRSAEGRLSLPVVLEIDGEGLLSGARGNALPLEIYGYAFDGQGRIVDALGLTPTLDLQAVGALVRSKGLQVLTAFRVEPGPVDLRFLVRDRASGRAASLRVGTTVPAFGEGARVVSPPLLMDDPHARVVIPTPSRANPALEIPFRLEQTPFTPQAAGTLRNGEPREVCVMAFGVATGSGLRMVAELLGQDGKALPLETGAARVVADTDGFQRVVAAVTPRSIPAGPYRLRLRLVDGSGDLLSPEVSVQVE